MSGDVSGEGADVSGEGYKVQDSGGGELEGEMCRYEEEELRKVMWSNRKQCEVQMR